VTNRIHVTLSQEVVDETLALMGQIEERLSFLQFLKPGEKRRLFAPRAATQEVLESIAALQVDAGLPLDDDDPMLADMSVHDGLTQIGDRLSVLAQRIEDTKFLAGSEGWSEGLIRYGMLRQLERSNPGLKARLDRLQRLIASNAGRRSPGEEPEPEPAE
jgi:hypothetical protein